MTKENIEEIKHILFHEYSWASTEIDKLDLHINDVIEATEQAIAVNGCCTQLPDLSECNQASLNYATKKDNPDFFLIKQTFKEGINWALNYVTKK